MVVVGGGFTGLSTAYHLKKADPGLSVALLESHIIGHGASGRNGGFNMTLFGLTLGITALRFGKSKAREAHLYMEKAVDLLRDLVAELNLDCDYEHPGFLRVATSETYKKRILHEIELAHKLGLGGIDWIDADRLAEEVRSPMYLGAWREPRCGILNPAKLAWAWKDVIAPLGVDVYEKTPVTEISPRGGSVLVSTPQGSVTADRVVLAANAWSHFFPQIRRKQVPVWTHIVLTEPLTVDHFSAIGWHNRQGIEDARNLVHLLPPDRGQPPGHGRAQHRPLPGRRHGPRPGPAHVRRAQKGRGRNLPAAQGHQIHPRMGRPGFRAPGHGPGHGLRGRQKAHLQSGMHGARREPDPP